jgi:4-amino-4-deoxy-L-arabinose transferase-like glycosyltransferase
MSNLDPVQRRDFLCIALFTAILYALVLAAGGPLTMHEGVLSQTTKAMLANHDWIVPRYGEAPWLERPPLPQWISCAICALIGHCDQEWNVRIGPALAGIVTVLLTTWLAGRFFGRGIGVLSGPILATMYNFARYSTLAEADIFLAPIVAGAICVFAYIEIIAAQEMTKYEERRAKSETGTGVISSSFALRSSYLAFQTLFGRRSWSVLFFFLLLGLTNLVKGMIFGAVIVLSAVGTFLLWNLRWRSLARYGWLWGGLVFFAVALPWPLLAYQRFPDALEVWKFDLFGRLNNHYLAQPPWYYFECLMWVPQPWTILALVGLAVSFKRLWRDGAAADRLVWCWAWMPLLVFSLSQGKHHHYMLHYLAPWAILAAQGTAWAWQRMAERWSLARPGAALVSGFAGLFILYVAGFAYKGAYLNRSREDTAFLREVRQAVPLDQPLLVESATEALEGLRMQFYVGDSVFFLHNLSYVRDDRIPGQDVYVVTRYNRRPFLEAYGQVEPVMKCKFSRREQSETERWTLFHLHLRDNLERKHAPERITPMQAMYREPGPDLDKR